MDVELCLNVLNGPYDGTNTLIFCRANLILRLIYWYMCRNGRLVTGSRKTAKIVFVKKHYSS